MGDPFPEGLVFRRGLPFHPVVSSFMAAVCGAPAVFRPDNPMRFEPEQSIELTGIVHRSMSLQPYQVHRNALDGLLTTETFRASLCMMLANHAYEAVKDAKDKSPAFEFFRHVRNASSHGNCFNFQRYEPARPAAWRGVEIDSSQKGKNNPLFGKQCFGAVLGISDLLLLLRDIEEIVAPGVRL